MRRGERDELSSSGVVRNLIVSVFLAVNLMSINLGYSEQASSGSAPVMVGWISCGLTILIFALLGRALFEHAFLELLRARLTMEMPILIGVVATMAFSIRSLVTGSGPIYFETSGILLIVYTLGSWLGTTVRVRALQEVTRLDSRLPREIDEILPDGTVATRKLEFIRAGQRVLVRAGSLIPVDGVIEKGISHVGDAVFTGEPLPRVHGEGDFVFSGTQAYDGDLVILVRATGDSTRMHSLVADIESAMRLPSRWIREADRVVSWFFPVVFSVAIATTVYWSRTTDLMTGVMNGLAVLVVACPCALGLATPIALWAGMAAFAGAGIRVRDPEAVERICEIDYAVLDKTGTLTRLSLESSDIGFAPGVRSGELLPLFAQLEAGSGHPFAAVFSRFMGRQESAAVHSLIRIPGTGIRGRVVSGAREFDLCIGNELLLNSRDREAAASVVRLMNSTAVASGAVIRTLYLKEGDRLIGIARVREAFVEDPFVFLRALDCQAEVLTGDPSPGTHKLLQQSGLGHCAARTGQDPETKGQRILQLKEAGYRVLYLGDGVNDAQAMANADVSVALAPLDSLAARTASFVVATDPLASVLRARAFSLEIRRMVRLNLRWAAGYNLIGVIVASLGLLTPVFAALLMTGSSLFVSWRSHRLRGWLLSRLE